LAAMAVSRSFTGELSLRIMLSPAPYATNSISIFSPFSL